ncbi:MAG: hypothetical protein U9P71_04125 [Campylobacterota bacterium]|nr:hypothetical protein [Campylobacterota bacterium]
MTYIFVAFKEEAKPLLQLWQFKRDKNAPCKLYVSDDIYLVITQMGQENASNALVALLEYLPPKENDCFINFGICAAPKNHAIGDVLECSHIYYKKESIELCSHPICKLMTVDTPASSKHNTAIDMEAFALFKTAIDKFKTCHCIKIVSDHFEPLHVNKKTVATLLNSGVATIKELVNENSYSNRN